MLALARKVKARQVSQAEIDVLVDFTKKNGGIEYAEKVMNDYAQKAKGLLAPFPDSDAKQALYTYVDYVVGRSLWPSFSSSEPSDKAELEELNLFSFDFW